MFLQNIFSARKSRPRSRLSGVSRLRSLYESAENARPVLVFGDSVSERISRDDDDQRTLIDMIDGMLPGKINAITYSAYHIGVFAHLLSALERCPYQPECIVVPINLRSFSLQWACNPAWVHNEDMDLAAAFARGQDNLPEEVTDPDPQHCDYSEYDELPVPFPEQGFETVGDLRKLALEKTSDPAEFKERIRRLFIYHYCFDLSTTHQRLQDLQRCIQEARKWGGRMVLYLTPINAVAGENYAGQLFVEKIERSRVMIKTSIENLLSPNDCLLDFLDELPPEMFFHDDCLVEHLCAEGRMWLAEKITQAVLSVKPV